MGRELDFERPVLEIERQIEHLRSLAAGGATGSSTATHPSPKIHTLQRQISKLEERAVKLKEQVFTRLSRWQTVQLARHPERPFSTEYIQRIFTDFVELHGDRRFGDDPAVIGGLARIRSTPVMVVGHQKGRSTEENVRRNFGMPSPEGYRKAVRLFQLADRFGLPIITLVDTPGAYPGLGAEERGQAQAIAESLEVMAGLGVPVISTVIGEGGSGGALAISVANRILMFSYATYSVISPEGCASILFKDAKLAERAADALKLTAQDLLRLKVIDQVVKEPLGGAHRDPEQSAEALADAISGQLRALRGMSPEELRDDRYRRFRVLGEVTGGATLVAPVGPTARKDGTTSLDEEA